MKNNNYIAQLFNEGLGTTFYQKPLSLIKKYCNNNKLLIIILTFLYIIFIIIFGLFMFYMNYPL